jgi:hypothetical protein
MHVDVILALRLGEATDRGLGGFNYIKFRMFHKPNLGYLFSVGRHFYTSPHG